MTDAASNSVPGRKLGSQGLEVSSLGLGANALPSRSEDESISLIKHAFQQGITFLDSANIYGNGASEIVIGKALKDLPRDRVQIATKCGFYRDASTGGTRIKGEPEYIRKCCEESLERLGTEYIDLYYQHRPDTSVPIEKTVGALKSLVEEGKVKYIGLSEVCANDIRRAHAVHPITAIQLEWSLWTRDVEEDILPVCRELGIGIVVYSPLGRGFFAGKGIVEALDDNDYRKRLHPRFQGDNFEKNKHFYEKVSAIAQKHGCTPAQLSLAWLLHRGEDIVPIPGTTKVPNLDENIGSVFVKLQPQEVAELSALPLSEIQGPRTSPLWINSTYNVTPETPALEI